MHRYWLLVVLAALLCVGCSRVVQGVEVEESPGLRVYQWTSYSELSREYAAYKLIESDAYPNVLQIHRFRNAAGRAVVTGDSETKGVKVASESGPEGLRALVIDGRRYPVAP